MSFIGGLIGGSQGQAGGFQAASPQNSSIVSPTDIRQFQGNLTSGLAQQQSLYDALAAQGGVQNQSNVFQQQQQLANQLQQQAAGQGPNPALAQLAQATGANTQNQAALMAGQRGAGQNAGMIARQAAQQGGANQQAMAGQAATMQAQQQLAARQQLMQQQQAMQGVAGTQVGQQQQQGNAYTQNALGATTGFLNAATGLQSNANNANASIASGNARNQAGLLGGVMGGIGSALGLAYGGEVPKYNEGGEASEPEDDSIIVNSNGSMLSKYLTAAVGSLNNPHHEPIIGKPSSRMGGAGDNMNSSILMASTGIQVPGSPKVKGDNSANDTVPAMLSPGEVVIPNHVMQGKNPAEAAKKFVAAILAKNGRAK